MWNKCKSRKFVSFAVALVALLSVVATAGNTNIRKYIGGSLFPKEKITVVAAFLGAPTGEDASEFENSMGDLHVLPYLEKQGYDVERYISLHELIESEGMDSDGALIKYFNQREPERDHARVLFITIVAKLDERTDRVSSALAFLDVQIEGMSKKVGRGTEIKWQYASPEFTLSPSAAAGQLEAELNSALVSYDKYRTQGGSR
jgi:hypothetical protein